MKQNRIGIFSGVFDPIHAGHIGFALAAIKEAKLDKVYLLIEPAPRRKSVVTHVAHRLAMARLATTHYPQIEVLGLPDSQFSVAKTLPRLKQRFPTDQLVLLAGSDTLKHMPDWPLITQLLKHIELVIALRRDASDSVTKQLVSTLPIRQEAVYIFPSPAPDMSSKHIRDTIRRTGVATSALPSLRSYILDNWLYVSPSASSSRSSS